MTHCLQTEASNPTELVLRVEHRALTPVLMLPVHLVRSDRRLTSPGNIAFGCTSTRPGNEMLRLRKERVTAC
jgi:hypothetical protein